MFSPPRSQRPARRGNWLGRGAALALLAASQPALGTQIIDQRGEAVSLDRPAERVVFLPMPAPAMFIAVDGTDRHVVAMNPSSKAAMREGLLGTLFPHMRDVPTDVVLGSGFAPNIEAILALNPDAVFQWANIGPDAIVSLKQAGLPVFGMLNSNQQDLAGSIAMMGKVADKNARADIIIRRQRDRQQSIEAALAGLADRDRPRVLYFGRFREEFTVAGPASYNDFAIRLAGGRNVVTPQAARSVTLEQVLAWNPEVILLGNFDTAMPADVYRDPRFADVAAVKNRRVYRMPLGGYRWDPPSQESALAWTWLLAILHPDKAVAELRDDMRTWYRLLYAHELTDDEIDAILFVKENAQSAGYARFDR
jgi:iron complex transport system substrate-binding protein